MISADKGTSKLWNSVFPWGSCQFYDIWLVRPCLDPHKRLMVAVFSIRSTGDMENWTG